MDSRTLPAVFRSRLTYTIVVAALFATLAGELWLSVHQLSQTADEGAHLYSGYEYWKAHDYGLNPEHPPMLKLVAAAPLLGISLSQPHLPPVNSKVQEYIGGDQFLYGNDADRLLWRARIAASVFSFLLAALVFAAGYEMFGPLAGLTALLLCVFEPTLLAHGALVTTDMVATCTIFAAVYALYRYQKQRSFPRLLVVGLALGLAAAAKFSSLVLLPIFVTCLIAELLLERSSVSDGLPPAPVPTAPRWQLALGWPAALVLGWIVLWAFYGFTYHARPGSAQLTPTLLAYAPQLPHAWEARFILAIARWHLLPESFLYGLVDLKVFGSHMPSFLLGKVYPGATKLYFPIAFLIKSTLPVLILLGSLPFLLGRNYVRYRRELVFLIIPVVIYFAISMNAPQNIGVRHILPIFPFVIMLAALGASLLATRSRTGAIAACALLFFHAASSLHAFPDYIPYSNEAFGGPSHTYRLLTDSNTDWGQGLLEVHAYLEKNHVTDCWFVPFGGGFFSHLDHYHIDCQPLPSGFARVVGSPLQVIPPTVHGTILVSTTEASGLFWGPQPLNPYADLLKRKPDAMIGNSVLVFHGDVALPLASAQTHSNASSLLLKQHKLPEALTEAQTAVALAPYAPDIQARLGAVLLAMGRKTEAEQAFANARTSAHTLDPRNSLKTEAVIAAIQH